MPIDLQGRHALNIFRVIYRSAVNGRRVTLWVKVPYGGMMDLADMLARQLSKGQLHYFRIDVAKTADIAKHRAELLRAHDALVTSSEITRVDWTA